MTQAKEEFRDIGWAMLQLRRGRKVKRASWQGETYLEFDAVRVHNAKIWKCDNVSQDSFPWAASQDDLLATDWEFVFVV